MIKRDNCFDFLRLFFALIVLFGHLICISMLPELQRFSPYFNTYLAVTGFFVISGFLIAQSYEHSESLKQYFGKRMRRLLPAYYMIVLCCAFGLVFLSTLSIKDYFFNKDWWQYLLANLCFLNFLHPALPGVFINDLVNDASVNPSLWTLKIEVAFYLILPLIMLWQHKAKKHWIPLAILYVASIGYRLMITYITTTHPSYGILSHQLPGFICYFMAGTAIYIYKDWFLQHKNHCIVPALLIWIVEYFCLNIEILSPACYGIVVIWCAYSLPKMNHILRGRDISYGVYIYNGPILKVLLTIGLFKQLGTWTALPIYLLIVLVVCLCSWKWLENPFLKR